MFRKMFQPAAVTGFKGCLCRTPVPQIARRMDSPGHHHLSDISDKFMKKTERRKECGDDGEFRPAPEERGRERKRERRNDGGTERGNVEAHGRASQPVYLPQGGLPPAGGQPATSLPPEACVGGQPVYLP